jgi:Transcriptional regulator
MANDGKMRARLLKGARKVFAEQGLQNATVRDSYAQARANVAAVNDQCGGKEKLYIAMLQDYIERKNKRHPRDGGVTPESPARERLRASARSMLLQTLDGVDADGERSGRLINQEYSEPSQHFDDFFDNLCKPSRRLQADLLRELPPEADELPQSRCSSSVVGQCMLFGFAREASSRMRPEFPLQADNDERMAGFITEFSLGGLEHIRSGFQA